MSDFLLNFKRFKAKAGSKIQKKSQVVSSNRLKKRVVEFADTSSSCGLSSDTEQQDIVNEISVTKNNIGPNDLPIDFTIVMLKEHDGQECEAMSKENSQGSQGSNASSLSPKERSLLIQIDLG